MKRNMLLYDSESNAYSGDVDAQGCISLYDDGGQYLYGEMGRTGNIILYDEANSVVSGDVDKKGNVSLYDDAGNHWSGQITISK